MTIDFDDDELQLILELEIWCMRGSCDRDYELSKAIRGKIEAKRGPLT